MTSTVSSKPASSPSRCLAVACSALALALSTAPAHASAPSGSPIAETLFRDGKALMRKGEYAKACPKLAESQRLEPASGTMLALALCHQKDGKLASAWAAYVDAEALARKDGRTKRAKAAKKRAAQLEPKLARLEITVSDAIGGLPDLQIRLDGTLLAQAVWGTPMPVDAGEHVVVATAADKEPWEGTVTISKPAERQQIEVGPLIDRPPEPPDEPAPDPDPLGTGSDSGEQDDSTALVISGGIVGGLGLVALGLGTFFGIQALDQIGEAQDRCTPERCTDQEAIDLNDSGALSADLSTGMIIGGGVATVTGVILLVAGTLGDDEPAADAASGMALRQVGLAVTPAGVAVTMGGGW